MFTDATGDWAAEDLPLGLYKVTFEKYGMALVELTLNAPATGTYGMGAVVMLPGLTTDPVAVSGKVYDELAAPLLDVKVVFTPKFAWGYERTAYTDEEGTFSIPSMIAGMYEMEIIKTGYISSGTYDIDLSVGGVDYNLGTFQMVTAP